MDKRGRPDKEDYFAIGAILTVLMLLWSAYTYQACGTVLNRCALEPIKEWQTLIAGGLAIGGAILSVLSIRKQINLSMQQEYFRRKKKVESLKGQLVHAISTICALLSADIQKLKLCEGPPSPLPQIEWPDQLASQFEVIRQVVEFEDDFPIIGKRLTQAVLRLQTYYSRRHQTFEKDVFYPNVKKNLILDNISTHVLIGSLFDYARRRSNILEPISIEHMGNQAVNDDVTFSTNQELEDLLKIWIPKSEE